MLTQNTTINYFGDSGHGWYEVEISELEHIGIADKISGFSYMKGKFAYLEEDCDASLLKDSLGFWPDINRILKETSKVRNYEGYDYSKYLSNKEASKTKRRLASRARSEAYASCGLKRVRGALGGIYYE